MTEPVPVAIFCYNRPAHLRAMLRSYDECLRRPETRPFIFCDGPKKPSENEKTSEVQSLAREWADQAGGELIASPVNLGLAASIYSGVTNLLEKFEKIIVLEDDLELHPGFLDFHLQCLDRYVDEKSVMQVSGYRHTAPNHCNQVQLLSLTSTWGWSTWRRAWTDFKLSAEDWPEDKTDVRRFEFDADGAYPYSEMMETRLAGKNQSWGILWYWHVFRVKGMVAIPPFTLLKNNGFDGTGVHCNDVRNVDIEGDPAKLFRRDVPWNSDLRWPHEAALDQDFYEQVRVALIAMRQLDQPVSVSKKTGGWKKRILNAWPWNSPKEKSRRSPRNANSKAK